MREDFSLVRQRFPVLRIMINEEKVPLKSSGRRLARAVGRYLDLLSLLHSCKPTCLNIDNRTILEFGHFGKIDDSRTA